MSVLVLERRESASLSPRSFPTAHLTLCRPGVAAFHRAAAASHRSAPLGQVRVSRPDRAMYMRRRLLAGGLFLLSVAAVLVLVQLIQAGIGGGPLTTTGAAAGPGMVQAGATEYVVRSGDTLWSIAASLEPGRDPRPLVDQLAHEVGGASLYPGQMIPIPPAR